MYTHLVFFFLTADPPFFFAFPVSVFAAVVLIFLGCSAACSTDEVARFRAGGERRWRPLREVGTLDRVSGMRMVRGVVGDCVWWW
jgi:hypothetical protein